MSLLDSEEWAAFAIELVDEYRYGFHQLFLRPKARESALLAALTAEDLPDLFACALGRDRVATLAAVCLLVRLVLSGDPRIADVAAEASRTLRAVAESADPEGMAGRLALLGWLEAAPREAGLFLRRQALEDILPLEAEIRFPLGGGGELVLEPGRHPIRVNLLDVPPNLEDETDWLLLRVDIADATGRVLRAHVPFPGHSFTRMLPRGLPASPGEGSVVHAAMSCYADWRQWVPVIELQRGEPTARAYWGKYLRISVTVRREHARGRIVLDVAPHEYGGIGGRAMPGVAASGHLIAKDVLAPRDWSGGGPRFHLTDERDEPQPGVRVADGGSGGENAPPLSSILQRILSDCIGRGHLWVYAGWLAGIRLSAAEALLQAVEPAGLPQYGEDDLCQALAHLVRKFGSTAALERLRQLSTASGVSAGSAHRTLALLGHGDPSRVERELDKWRQTRGRDTALWLIRAAYERLRVEGATRESVRDQVTALLGPASRETESTLTYDMSDDSEMHLYVRVASAGRDRFQTFVVSGTTEPPSWAVAKEPPAPLTRATFAVGADVLFATDDGRRLRIGSAGATATLRLEGEPPYEIRPDTSSVRLALFLSDEQGRMLKASRPLTASLLLDAWRASDVGSLCRPDQYRWTYPLPSTQPALDGVRIFWPEARLVVAEFARHPDDKTPAMAPRLLELTGRETPAVLHLGANTVTTVVRLTDDPDGRCGFFTAEPLATMVLMPSLLGARADVLPPTVFVDTGLIEAPTPGVRLEPS